ncbi:MAG: hypothetical protein LC804_02015, partial [Acidobacteria bacterium]|nr:hypothetical protein [Acidobacteriota bacterium]
AVVLEPNLSEGHAMGRPGDLREDLSKPKAARAAMEHNLDWFNEYVWREKPTRPITAGQQVR